MNEKVQKAINEQIGLELYSAYTYLAMSAHFAEENFEGFAHWMRLQAQEELGHAMRLFDYLLERGAHVELPAVDSPSRDFGTPLEVFEAALEHERHVTAKINELYEMAREEKDHPTELHLQWFIDEQVEEEAQAELAVDQLRRAGDHMPALIILDRQFGERSSAE